MLEVFSTPVRIVSHLLQILRVHNGHRDCRFHLNPHSGKNNLAGKSCFVQPRYLSLASKHKGMEQDFSDYFSVFFPPLTTEFTHKKKGTLYLRLIKFQYNFLQTGTTLIFFFLL